MGCCATFSKIVLVIVNTIFWLASALMLAFGIAGKANPDAVKTIFNYILPASAQSNLQNVGVDLSSIVADNAVFMIIVGVVGIVIATIGFVGACCTVRWLLVTYAILLILLLLAEIALIIFAAVWSSTFQNLFQQGMRDSIEKRFLFDVTLNGTGMFYPNDGPSAAWGALQLGTKCCGAYNYTDYMAATNWKSKGNGQSVPLSCCLQTNSSSSSSYQFVDQNACMSGTAQFINSQNCYNAVESDVKSFIQNFKGIAIGIAAGIAGIEIILIVMAFVLCARKEKDAYV